MTNQHDMTARKKSFRFERRHLLGLLLEAYVLFPLFMLALLVVLWFTTMHLIRIENATADRVAADSTLELIESYEAQMIRNLGGIAQTLKTIKYAYELKNAPTVLAELEEKGLLPHKLVFTVSIADSSGHTVASTSHGANEDIRQQPYFLHHESNDSGRTHVDLIGQPSHEPKIQFSLRLVKGDGSFGGMAMVSAAPDYFTSVYEHSKLGEKGVLGLIGADGAFLIRRTGEQVSVGEPAFNAGERFDLNDESDGYLPEVHFVDGVPRYVKARRLFGFPLAIVVGLSKAEQFERAKKQTRYYLLGATILSVLLVTIAATVSRLLWQLAQSRNRTRKNQETRYAASEASNDAIGILRAEEDRNGNILDFIIEDVNNKGASLLGRRRADLLGTKLCDQLPGCRDNGIFDELVRVFRTGVSCEAEWKPIASEVSAAWLHRQVVPVEDGVVAVIRDISERKRVEERISHMAHHDALTGLPNRTLLHDRIHRAIMRSDRERRPMTVVFMDLDDFKPVNDAFGHWVGDELLKMLAKRMVQAMRQTDTVARLGGDEFVMVLEDQPESIKELSPTLQRIRSAISEFFDIDGHKIQVTTSMGMARYPSDGADSATLLMKADAAMYRAKARGNNEYQYYIAGMDEETGTHQN